MSGADDIDGIDLEAEIIEIASHHERNPDRFTAAAARLAERLRPHGVEGPDMLLDLLEPTPALPWELEQDFDDETWRAACGAGVVAVLDACGPDAIDALFDIAIGHAPGPAPLAEDVLVRFAKEGEATVEIVNRLAEAIDVMDYDAERLDKLIDVGHATPELIDKVREVIDSRLAEEVDRDDDGVITAVGALITLAPDDAIPYATVLREWVLRGISYGPDDEDYTESEAPIMEWRGIRSALALHRLYPDDIPIREALRYWSETHVNEEIRGMIGEALGNSEV